MQQALELTTGSEITNKKKVTESVRPVAFRSIAPIEISTLKVEIKNSKPKTEVKETAKLFVETVVEEEEIKVNSNTAKTQATTVGTLSKMREQIANRRQNVAEECEPLEEKKLQELWKQYTAQLAQNKSSAVKSFELATLEIKDENNFEAISNNSLEQIFIEQEKRVLSEFLQKDLIIKNSVLL